jgi:hypothetical protein
MKDDVLHGLLTARTLFDTARTHCFVRDRHVASAGLIVVQDALELVLYSCLLEIGADEEKAIETLSFDQLLGELRQRGLRVVKSGTLKAMNKQRVLIKHHAQLAEPSAVQQYYQVSVLVADDLLKSVIGKPLQHVVIADAISNPELVDQVNDATAAINEQRYLDAMIATRKALYLAIESAYDTRRWAEHDGRSFASAIGILSGKAKAPYYTRNRQWVAQNVSKPTDYIRLDYDLVTTEMLQIGIDPEEFFNVRRLTPDVYRLDSRWTIAREPEHDPAATEDNARYCLDVVVSIIRNQESRKDIIRPRPSRRMRATLLCDQPLLNRAARDASADGTTLLEGAAYDVQALVTGGMDGNEEYVEVLYLQRQPPLMITGYIPRGVCVIEEY